MKIECLIIRPEGTKVDFDAPKRQYHFKPDAEFDGRHIAEVGEASHAAMLLRIREAYKAVDGDVVQAPSAEDTDIPDRVLKGSQVHDARYTIHGGDEIELDDLVSMAFDDSGLSETDWNDLPDQERYEYIDATLNELKGPDRDENITPEPVSLNPQSSAEPHTPPVINTPSDVSETPAPEQPEPETLPEGTTSDTPTTADALANLTHDELRERFKEKFGRFPSNKMKDENIITALNEDDD